MNEKEVKIQSLVGELVENKDIASLDVLFTLSYSGPNTRTYANKELSENWLGRLGLHNLQIKHNLKIKEAKEKLEILIEAFDDYPIDFRDILIKNSKEIMKETIKKQLQNANEIQKKALSFVLNYIPLKLEEAQKAAHQGKYGYLSDFHVHENEVTEEILYYKIDPKEWTYTFNEVFDERLGISRTYRWKGKTDFLGITPSYQERLWEFGDILVKLGIGYWTFWVSNKGYPYIDFTIPAFLYEHARKYKDLLPRITKDTLIQAIKRRHYAFIDFEGEDIEKKEFLEVEIENTIAKNLKSLKKA